MRCGRVSATAECCDVNGGVAFLFAHRCPDRSWADGVDADAVLCVFEGGDLAHCDHCGVVCDLAGDADWSVDGGDVDDLSRAAAAERGDCGARRRSRPWR